MSDDPVRNMKNENFCSQLSTYFKRHMGFSSKRTFGLLRAAGETETTQENIEDWFELDGDPGFHLLTEEEISAVIFFI
jgi:hypothetical protein